MTMAPLVAKGKVYVGNSGGEMGVRGWITALDAKSGKKFETVNPANDEVLAAVALGDAADNPDQRIAEDISGGTIEAIDGRAIHAYHVEGAGGGHIPDLIALAREPKLSCEAELYGRRFASGAASGTVRASSSSARESMKQAELNVCASMDSLPASRSASPALRSVGSMRRVIISDRSDGPYRTCLADPRGAREAQARP